MEMSCRALRFAEFLRLSVPASPASSLGILASSSLLFSLLFSEFLFFV